MAKLWQKGYSLHPRVESFITGKDFYYDLYLLPADCVGSMAHVHTLAKASLLTSKETRVLLDALLEIFLSAHEGKFRIQRDMEDSHTAIENHLRKKFAKSFPKQENPSEKIHTGRSRNDQVQASLRLFYKEFIFRIQTAAHNLLATLYAKAKENQNVPMPGRTHLQKAMPSSVGLWFASFAEQLLDDLDLLETAYTHIDRSPLGSAAGYATPLPLDRKLTASLLGFSEVQNNVIAVQNSRGRLELNLLFALQQISITLSRLSEDLILFSLPEFAYFSLPDSLCSGSSIMPQKKNPDLLELLRSRTAFFSGAVSSVASLVGKLPSGYQRDLQDTKPVGIQACIHGQEILLVSELLLRECTVNKQKLAESFDADIYATDHVFALLQKGMSFRSAYKHVASKVSELETLDPQKVLKNRTMQGSSGNPNFSFIQGSLQKLKRKQNAREDQFYSALKNLLYAKKQNPRDPVTVIPRLQLEDGLL